MQINSILETLNIVGKDGLFYLSDLLNASFLTTRTKDILIKINPTAFFCINNEPLILFFDNPSDFENLQKQIWNFNQACVIFVVRNNRLSILNGFNYIRNKGLDDLAPQNNISDFEYFKLITGETWENYKSKFDQSTRVDEKLLTNIQHTRNLLRNSGLPSTVANSLIGRVIFIRYLIDRTVELKKYNVLSKEGFYDLLKNKDSAYDFFEQILNDFNGNLFPLEYEIDLKLVSEQELVSTSDLSVIVNLLKGDDIRQSGKTSSTQLSMFDIYDFSIIPIEFVSNVYEKFIGAENQATQGAYYTPLFLVDYIQKETVSKYFNNNSQEYNCKVLDPACGSGIFLVETLRQIISQYKKNHPDYSSNYDQYKITLKALLSENIFGIDKDESAISVAIFSLYITLLDYLEPSSIVGFEFPHLKNSNFFVADFFDVDNDFNEILSHESFQFVLGNPPWMTKHKREKQCFEKYIEKRKQSEGSNLEIVEREIAEAFLVRVSDFSFAECAFIVVSKILYKIEKSGIFRNYFLNRFKLRQVFELSSVRHQIFENSNDKAVAPATILFYSNQNGSEVQNNNVVVHISMKPNIFFETFKLLVIEKYDYKEILQQFFLENDWLWKVLVYGNILDYFFIRRLRDADNFSSIKDITSDPKRFVRGQGLKFTDGQRKVDTSSHKNYFFLGSLDKNTTNYKQFIRQYYTSENLPNWDGRFVGYFPENPIIFNAPSLLITGGITNDFKSVSALQYNNALFKSSLTAIKAIFKEDIKILKSIAGILNSSFFSYYILSNGSSTGIEREETHDSEKWDIPFVSSDGLVDFVTQIEAQVKSFYSNDMVDSFSLNAIQISKDAIDRELYSLYNLSPLEKSLVKYTNEITIPLLKGKDTDKAKILRKVKFEDKILEEYAAVFIEHFEHVYQPPRYSFKVQIIHSNHAIAISFKIAEDETPSIEYASIQWIEKGFQELLTTFSSIAFDRISHNLFMQKDIKGFEHDSFYIVKPNQFKSWQPAIAYLDLSEIVEAIENAQVLANG